LGVGLDLAGGISVDAGEVLVGTLAGLKSTVLGVVRSVIGTSDTVEDMLAVVGGIGASRVTDLETENVAAHEVVPLDDLPIGLLVGRKTGGVYKTTKGVTTEISTVGVELSSSIVGQDVDLGLVDDTDNLLIVRSLHILDTFKGARGDETRAMTWLGAPSDFFSLRAADIAESIRGRPKTEVVDRVEDGGLAEGLLVFGRRVAPVVTGLRATDAGVWVSLVREVTVVKMLGSQGNDGRGGDVLGVRPG